MGRLFWKIFLWFWVTMILMTLGIAWGMAQFFHKEDALPNGPIARHAMTQVLAVTSVLKYSGAPAAKVLLQEMVGLSPLQILVVDDQGQELLGRPIPEVHDSESGNQTSVAPSAWPRKHINTVPEQVVLSPDGQQYRVIPRFSLTHRPLRHATPMGPLGPLARNPWIFFIRLTMALLVSGLVCFWLAWYLARPVRRLREASQRLSEGELDVRIGPASGRRRDEIADLGQDFDRMAEHLQQLMLAQKQLLTDVSHELRSPLARLQVALELARKKSGELAADELDRIEREAERLDDLIGQALTLSRLEMGVIETREDYVDIALLLEEITQDAEFESIGHNRHIILHSNSSKTIKANAELLRRALENVVRNAMHYTIDDSQVEVTLSAIEAQPDWVSISVCDQGPGVAEEHLTELFEPFFRVAKSRARASGGYGLGLAIAKRAVNLHEGSISASNRSGSGLCITIQLPSCIEE